MTIDEAINHAYETALEKSSEMAELLNSMHDTTDCKKCMDEHQQLAHWLEELKEYKKQEELGRRPSLPCGIHETIYADSEVFGILEYRIDNIIINKNSITYMCSAHSKPVSDCPSECLDEIEVDSTEFGKTVFFTREEAENS